MTSASKNSRLQIASTKLTLPLPKQHKAVCLKPRIVRRSVALRVPNCRQAAASMSSLSASCLEVSSLKADLHSTTRPTSTQASIAVWPRELWDSEVILRFRILFVIAPLLGQSLFKSMWKTMQLGVLGKHFPRGQCTLGKSPDMEAGSVLRVQFEAESSTAPLSDARARKSQEEHLQSRWNRQRLAVSSADTALAQDLQGHSSECLMGARRASSKQYLTCSGRCRQDSKGPKSLHPAETAQASGREDSATCCKNQEPPVPDPSCLLGIHRNRLGYVITLQPYATVGILYTTSATSVVLRSSI